ncbi:MAG: SWIM zinc finger family protein [Woeseiaceae bacterium]
MQQLDFLVKGSSAEPYEITFIKDGDSLTAICTCPAGTYGNFCKHRIAILDGDSKAVSSDNADKVATVVEWLPGTDVAEALAQLRAAESEGLKDAVAKSKKKLARAMNT